MMDADLSGLTLILQRRCHCVSSSMALCNLGRMFPMLFDLRYSAVSSANNASWTPVDGRGISFTYAETAVERAWSLEVLQI
ncbi:hypothetical protein EVAR_35676_1 [Eumeta japonica]|uniref:Uncharacterized protein n=1 Tax=Eumeta variegata TaxID=151549 RepID=A0A4C1VF45_EUMVA|nr:hypothetical protein EVAR_35676_1 [Eumeta japonica]